MTDDELLDHNGVLRREMEPHAAPARSYRVFLQRFEARFDAGTLETQAARFFGTKLGLMAPKRYGAAAPMADFARLAIAIPQRSTELRAVFMRPVRGADHDLASALEIERGATGLGGLARRCNMVAEIERLHDADLSALTLAAVFASVHLGPIMDLDARDIFGVKTARARIEAMGLTAQKSEREDERKDRHGSTD